MTICSRTLGNRTGRDALGDDFSMLEANFYPPICPLPTRRPGDFPILLTGFGRTLTLYASGLLLWFPAQTPMIEGGKEPLP